MKIAFVDTEKNEVVTHNLKLHPGQRQLTRSQWRALRGKNCSAVPVYKVFAQFNGEWFRFTYEPFRTSYGEGFGGWFEVDPYGDGAVDLKPYGL